MGFCGWPVQIPAEYADQWAAATPEQQAHATALAGRVLWALTGQVFGVCADCAGDPSVGDPDAQIE